MLYQVIVTVLIKILGVLVSWIIYIIYIIMYLYIIDKRPI